MAETAGWVHLRGRHGSIDICPLCGRAINLTDPRVVHSAGGGEKGVRIHVCVACQPKFVEVARRALEPAGR